MAASASSTGSSTEAPVVVCDADVKDVERFVESLPEVALQLDDVHRGKLGPNARIRSAFIDYGYSKCTPIADDPLSCRWVMDVRGPYFIAKYIIDTTRRTVVGVNHTWNAPGETWGPYLQWCSAIRAHLGAKWHPRVDCEAAAAAFGEPFALTRCE